MMPEMMTTFIAETFMFLLIPVAFYFGRRSVGKQPYLARKTTVVLKPNFKVLPNQLVIQNGFVVAKADGTVPIFDDVFNGIEVNVVPHYDLKRMMIQSSLYREGVRAMAASPHLNN